MKFNLRRDLVLLFAAAFARALGIGLTGVLLGIYLSQLGFSATAIGAVVASGLAGVAAGTLTASFRADRWGRRRTLAALSLLAAAGGAGLAWTSGLAPLLAVAFLGMVNGMGRDRGPAYALEQAIIPALVPAEQRTPALAWYTLVQDAGHAVGALAGAAPFLLRKWLELDLLASYRLTFLLYAALGLLTAALYLLLSSDIEVARPQGAPCDKLSPQSREIVARLAALFGLDSLGGGFLTGALVSYWFFRRFGVAEEALGPLFFAVRLANAASYLVAARLARRIGLVNTMVFTHLPSSLLLLAVPLVPTFGWAVAIFLLRECLVEMDVPTRQSYTLAVVAPHERTLASGITNLTRSAGWAVGPSLAGWGMQQVALATPLFAGGAIKVVYDLLLYFSFRRHRPPEEQPSSTRPEKAPLAPDGRRY
ncbi:MAG: MFS transporter [Candidatus Acidiferrales bacterium]